MCIHSYITIQKTVRSLVNFHLVRRLQVCVEEMTKGTEEKTKHQKPMKNCSSALLLATLFLSFPLCQQLCMEIFFFFAHTYYYNTAPHIHIMSPLYYWVILYIVAIRPVDHVPTYIVCSACTCMHIPAHSQLNQRL